MDGTLVDTEPYWMASEVELVDEFGGHWTHEDGLLLVGSGLWNSAAILQAHGVPLDADEIVDRLTNRVQELIDRNGVPWRPGAKELLGQLREAGVPTALVTMSVRRMAEQIVSHIPFEAFDAIIAGDEVERAKPDPEPYLVAARRLAVDPIISVAIEDSVAGLESAIASGALTIGVPHIVPLPSGDDHVLWDTLQGRTVEDVREVIAGRIAARAALRGQSVVGDV
jgi:HAD superfamily hydrolase (TIGR01509 family)